MGIPYSTFHWETSRRTCNKENKKENTLTGVYIQLESSIYNQ